MKKSIAGLVALFLVVALAMPVTAKPVSKNIRLAQDTKVGASQINAGEYRLTVDGDKVTIRKGSKIAAEVNGRWEQREAKYQYDSYVIDRNGTLNEVRFAGSNQVLVLVTP